MLEDRIREWKAQFRQEGLQEGLEQGVEQGVEQGARTMLHRQLLRRFGSVPEPLAQQLAGATLPQLEAWADLVYEAETIEDVFH